MCPRETKGQNEKIGDKELGEGEKRNVGKDIGAEGQGLLVGIEETDIALRQLKVEKRKCGNPVLA